MMLKPAPSPNADAKEEDDVKTAARDFLRKYQQDLAKLELRANLAAAHIHAQVFAAVAFLAPFCHRFILLM